MALGGFLGTDMCDAAKLAQKQKLKILLEFNDSKCLIWNFLHGEKGCREIQDENFIDLSQPREVQVNLCIESLF